MVGKITKVAVMLLLFVTCAMADEFRVTAFSVGETSVCFSVAWPVSQTFPDGTIDVLYHPTLTFEVDEDGELDAWWHAREVPVVQSLGVASFEVPFGDLAGINPDEIGACFFLLRISDIGGILAGGSGGQDEGGDPPDPATDDPADTGSAEWATLTGTLGAGVEATLDETLEVFPDQTYVFVVYSYSTEFPNWTSSQSQYDDVLTWDVSLPDGNTLSGSLHVNSRHNDWLEDQANGVSAQGYSPVHVEGVAVVTVPNDAAAVTGFRTLRRSRRRRSLCTSRLKTSATAHFPARSWSRNFPSSSCSRTDPIVTGPRSAAPTSGRAARSRSGWGRTRLPTSPASLPPRSSPSVSTGLPSRFPSTGA